ncbi:MAG: hypothetical protein ACKO8Q_08625, partial [Bacteroidota bacterium]
ELQDFVNRYPQSQFIKQANDSIIKLEWFAIAITGDISSVENFLKKFPNSYYNGQALKRFDELLWKSTNVASVESLEDYLKDCKSCVFKENALEKLSLIEWDKIKLAQDTMLLNDFLHRFPKSSKVNIASKRKAELVAEIDFQVARKVHGFAPCDSFETEDYWIEKHGSGVVKKYYNSDSNEVIEIFGNKFVTMIDWEFLERTNNDYMEFDYCGFSQIVNLHVIRRSTIDYGDFVYVINNGEVITESELLSTRIIPSNYKTTADVLDITNLVDVIRLDNKLRWIGEANGPEYGSGFAILNSEIGIAKFYQESETFNFIKYNQKLSDLHFVNFNQCFFAGEHYLNDNSFKNFNGIFNYNKSSNQWQVLKK